MAAGGPVRDLCEEVTCPICLEYFRDPVILTECGHNFCRDCLIQSWGTAAAETFCSVCKQIAQSGDLRPNRQLANVVEIAKKLSLQGGEARKEEARERSCEKHREPLKLWIHDFCVLLRYIKSFIREIEEKHQQPVSELLQDVRDTLKRYERKETFENPEVFPCKLKQWVLDCCYNPFLKSAVKQFKDTLPWAFPKLRVTVTLDPASASSCLDFSGIQKSVRWRSTTQDLSEDPEKHYGFVLGTEGFTAGCHFWEVSVLFGEGWAVGVARKPVKDKATLTPEEGIWAVGRRKGQYKAFIKDTDPPLNLSRELKKIQVCLNYNGGQVAFFDADRAALLYEFPGASFFGETIYPFFAVYSDGWLWLFP